MMGFNFFINWQIRQRAQLRAECDRIADAAPCLDRLHRQQPTVAKQRRRE
jgi:hypothetical protein